MAGRRGLIHQSYSQPPSVPDYLYENIPPSAAPSTYKNMWPAGSTQQFQPFYHQGQGFQQNKNWNAGKKESGGKRNNKQIQSWLMNCSRCKRCYNNRERKPLILSCNHTTCKECIKVIVNHRQSVRCPDCNAIDSTIAYNMETDHRVNFYLLGVLTHFRVDMNDMTVVNFQPSFETTNQVLPPVVVDTALSIDCSSCRAEAEFRCLDCAVSLCRKCSIKLHNGAELAAHKLVAFKVGQCKKHNAKEDFYCISCRDNYCAYCVIKEHGGHSLRQRTHLDDKDQEEIGELLKVCEEVLNKVRSSIQYVELEMGTSKKCTKNNAFERSLNILFASIHAKLQNLHSDIQNRGEANLNAHQLQKCRLELHKSESLLSHLATAGTRLLDKSQDYSDDVQLIMEGLRKVPQMPCKLVKNVSVAEAGFVYPEALEDLRIEHFFPTTQSIKLVKQDESSAGFEELPIDFGNLTLSNRSSLSSVSSAIAPPSSWDSSKSSSKNTTVHNFPTVNSNKSESRPKVAEGSDKTIRKRKIDQSEIPLSPLTPPFLPKAQLFNPSTNSSGTLGKLTFISKPDMKNNMQMVVISHVKSPSNIFVNFKSQLQHMEDLHSAIETHVARATTEELVDPVFNGLYLARNKLEGKPNWCRVRVLQTNFNTKMYVVFYIDFGCTSKVKNTDLRTMPQGIEAVPPMVYECKLYGLFPTKNQWNTNVSTFISEILSDGLVLMVIIKEGEPLEVDFIAYHENNEFSIKDSLVFMGFAKYHMTDDCEDAIYTKISQEQQNSFILAGSNFKAEDKVQVIVSHVIDPHNIYIQLYEHQQHLDAMHKRMNEFYLTQKKGNVYNPKENMAVAVKSSESKNNKWFRGRITEAIIGTGMVTVFLVDIGTTVKCSWHLLRVLNERFVTMQCQAILVKLAHVEVQNSASSWSDEAKDFLRKYIGSQEQMEFVVMNCGKGEVAEGVLFECYPTVHNCINAMLVENNYAVSTGEMSQQVSWHQQEERDESAEDMFTTRLLTTSQGRQDAGDSESDDSENLTNVPHKYVEVLNIRSPGRFYVTFNRDETMMKKLNDLHIRIQHFYVTSDLEPIGAELVKELPNDRMVIARNAKDRKYYRVLVEKEIVAGKYEVFSRDYAFYFECKLEDIGPLEEDFMTEPAFACRCHLYGIRPAGREWSLTAKDFLTETLAIRKRNTIFCKVGEIEQQNDDGFYSMPTIMMFEEVKTTKLLECPKIKTYNINKLLVNMGLAIREKCLDVEQFASKEIVVIKEEQVIELEAEKETLPPATFKHSNLPSEMQFNIIIINFTSENTIIFELASPNPDEHDAFETLDMEINSTAHLQNDLVVPEVDKPCLAKFSDDSWYRAKIQHIQDDGKVIVHFVDYGNFDEVSLEDLKEIPFNWLEYPVQQHLATLDYFEKPENASSYLNVEKSVVVLKRVPLTLHIMN